MVFEESGRKDLLESVYFDSGYIDIVKMKFIDEFIKIVNLFFNVFEFYFMWEYIVKVFFDCDKLELFESYCDDKGFYKKIFINFVEVFWLIDFIFDVVILVSCLIIFVCFCLL